MAGSNWRKSFGDIREVILPATLWYHGVDLTQMGPEKQYLDSRQNVFDHIAVNIRQPKIAPLIPIRQLFVVEAEAMQNRRAIWLRVLASAQRKR